MTDRDEREDCLSDLSKWDLVEKAIVLEDSNKAFMDLDDVRLKQIEKLKGQNKILAKGFMNMKLDPSRLESALRMYVAELDYDIHKNIQCGEEDGLDRYPEEVDFFLRCWETAGEGQ